jgi:hypothetical protein
LKFYHFFHDEEFKKKMTELMDQKMDKDGLRKQMEGYKK